MRDYVSKLFILLVISILCGAVFSLIAGYLCSIFFDLPLEAVSRAMLSIDSPKQRAVVKFMVLFNSIGIFILPAVLFSVRFFESPSQFLKLNRIGPPYNFVLTLFILLSFIPLLNVFVVFNKAMVLPDFLAEVEQWMRLKEDGAMRITEGLLTMKDTKDLWLNLFVVGLVPALGEELIFRGIVQQLINQKRKNYHIGIWVSAFIFSAIHLQFYGFLPRLLLGALFGYLFHWSATIWIPIFAHLVNNATAVIIAYYFKFNGIEEEIEKVGTTETTWPLSLLFAIVCAALLYRFYNGRPITTRS